MIADQLRNSILQDAVSGRLTEQLPSDGDAQQVISEIDAEKARMVAAREMRREKPLSPIVEDEIPFDIPANWAWVRLGNIVEIVGGGTPKTSDRKAWQSGTIPWLTPADMKNVVGKYVTRGARLISQHGLANSSAVLVPKGTVIYSSRAPIGYVAIADNELSTNQGFKSSKPIVGVLSEYLYYLLIAWTPRIKALGAGTTFKEVSGAVMRSIVVPLPPTEEQYRIVSQLDSLMEQIDELAAQEGELDALQRQFPKDVRESILQNAMVGHLTEQELLDGNARELLAEIHVKKSKLVLEGKLRKAKPLPPISVDEFPFDIPANWAWGRLSEIADLRIGKTPARVNQAYWGAGLPWVSIRDMQDGGVTSVTKEEVTSTAAESVFNGRISPAGTLIMSFKLTIGKVSILGVDAFHNEAIVSIIPYSGGEVLRNYLFKVLPLLVAYGDSKGAIKGRTLNTKSLGELLVPCPPLVEQERILQQLDGLLSLCEPVF